jgi:hypothetical protein
MSFQAEYLYLYSNCRTNLRVRDKTANNRTQSSQGTE